MRLLLSAYACEPDRGSEPGIGWNWAHALARAGVEVWVLTRANNRERIEAALAREPQAGLHFLYYDLPPWLGRFKRGGRGVRAYYYLWQIGALGCARRAHREQSFDLVQHLTFGVFRLPSLMGALGIPFVFGPLGGGERAPWRLRRGGYGWRGWLADCLRDLANFAVWFDPLMHYSFFRAGLIYAKTAATRARIPRPYRRKIEVQLELIAPVESEAVDEVAVAPQRLRVLFIGRLLYWKGAHLALRALAHAIQERPDLDFTLTLVGDGPSRSRLESLAERLGIGVHLHWQAPVARERIWSIYAAHDVLLFPSLHDSSGNVVIEALSHGLPVVCLRLGGPGEMVTSEVGRVIEPMGLGDSVAALAAALVELADDPPLRRRLAAAARHRVAAQYAWPVLLARLLDRYDRLLGCPGQAAGKPVEIHTLRKTK